MSKEIIDARRLLNIVKDKVKKYTEDKQLKLVILTDHSDPASEIYLRNKKKHCQEVGIDCEIIDIKEYSKKDALATLQKLNLDDSVTGIIVQLPCELDYADELIAQIGYVKDVDGLTGLNKFYLYSGRPLDELLLPCTPQGIMWVLDSLDFKYDGAYVIMCGRSELVGRPLLQLLNKMNCTVLSINSHTDYSKISCDGADLIISAIGKPKFYKVTGDYAEKNTILIDVGINRDENGKMCGDFDLDNCDFAKATKVPGGIGLMTIGSLLYNVTKADRIQRGIREDI